MVLVCVKSLFAVTLSHCYAGIEVGEDHGVGEELWQRLVFVQCMTPSKEVTTTADVLDELGLKEEATQLRGWLVCQTLALK